MATVKTFLEDVQFNGVTTIENLHLSVVAATSTYVALATDELIVCNTAVLAFTVTLPTAVGIAGKRYRVKKSDSSLNPVTVQTTSSQTIDGATSILLQTQYNCLDIVSDGTNWRLV